MTSFLSALLEPTSGLIVTNATEFDIDDSELKELLDLPSDQELADLANEFLL